MKLSAASDSSTLISTHAANYSQTTHHTLNITSDHVMTPETTRMSQANLAKAALAWRAMQAMAITRSAPVDARMCSTSLWDCKHIYAS